MALKDDFSPCGICPSPELKRCAFSTLSLALLSGRTLGSSKAERPFGFDREKACGALSQVIESRVAPAICERGRDEKQESRLLVL